MDERRNRKGRGKREKKGKRIDWKEEGRERFIERIGKISNIEGGINEELREVGKRIREALEEEDKTERVNRKERGEWWDGESWEAKRAVMIELRAWRRGESKSETYRQKKREFKLLCGEKRRQDNERWEKEIEEEKMEGQIGR